MRKYIQYQFLTLLFLAVSLSTFAQLGVGTTTPQGVLDVVSTDSGVIMPRLANTAAVTSPVNGMIIYDESTNCLKAFQNGLWSDCFVVTNAPPVASSVSFTGTLTVGQILTGTYTYSDAENDAENTSTVIWYRADDAAGANAAPISGATSLTYSLQADDETKHIAFEVTPVAATGMLTGAAVVTAYQGPVAEVPSTTGAGGATWMDRNLGATQVATSTTDAASYGFMYQWGRGTDGHQIRTSSTTATLSTTDTPGHGNFITTTASPSDWRSGQNGNLWQGLNGTNNPCPDGFRIPTMAEFETERNAWSPINITSAFNSLKFTLGGYRGTNGSISNAGGFGYYWSSTINGNNAHRLFLSAGGTNVNVSVRGLGLSVRCIQD